MAFATDRRVFAIPAVLLALITLFHPVPLAAQAGSETEVAEPFKVGTFEIGGDPRIGLVLRDALVVDVGGANQLLERNPAYPRLPMPADMLDLIARYDYGVRLRLYEIVNYLAANDMIEGEGRPRFVHNVQDLRTLPPIMYPGKVLNAAVNFYSHVNETGTEEERTEARRQRRVNRGVPYLFLKPSRGAVIGTGDSVVLPYGRDEIDWEVELGTVIGRTAKYVSADDAPRLHLRLHGHPGHFGPRRTPPLAGTPCARTGSLARGTTPSPRWALGSRPRSSTAIQWRSCGRR